MNIKEELIKIPNLINKETFRVNGNIFRKEEYKNLKKEIENKFSQYENIKMNEMLYLIFHDLEERPKCECERHGELTFITYASGYYTFCGKPNVCSLNAINQANFMQDRKKSMTIEEKDLMYEKIKNTNLERYGVDNYFKNPEFIKNNYNEELVKIRDKNRKEKLLDKYGVECVFQLDEVKEKISQSNIEKYGVPNYMQTLLSDTTLELLNDKLWLEDILTEYSAEYVSKKLSCDNTTIFKYIEKHNIDYVKKNISTEEYLIKDILEKNNIEFIMNDKSILSNNHELDFYIPKHNFAIEVNGLYWHCEKNRQNKNYHQNKYDICLSQGVSLVQFWDNEINNNLEVIESFILNKCKMTKNKIYARNVKLEYINNTIASKFISENHLQEITDKQISVSIGAFNNNKLVSVISFRRNKDKFILTRYCTLKNLNVVGVFSKFMSYFRKDYNNEIITYSDNRYSSGLVYSNNSFEKIRTNDVSYHYTKDFKKLIHKSNFMKSKMINIENFYYNKTLTEHQNMINNKYYRVYGCKIDTWKYTK